MTSNILYPLLPLIRVNQSNQVQKSPGSVTVFFYAMLYAPCSLLLSPEPRTLFFSRFMPFMVKKSIKHGA